MYRRISVRAQAGLFALIPITLFGLGIAILEAQSGRTLRSNVSSTSMPPVDVKVSPPRTMPPIDKMPGAETFLRLSSSATVNKDPAVQTDIQTLRAVVESLAKQIDTLRAQNAEVAKNFETQKESVKSEATATQIQILQAQLETERSRNADLRRSLDAAVSQQASHEKSKQLVSDLERKLADERTRSREIKVGAELAAEKVRIEALNLEKAQWLVEMKKLQQGMDAAAKHQAESMKKLLDQTETDKQHVAGEAKSLRSGLEEFRKEHSARQSKIDQQVQELSKDMNQRQKQWTVELSRTRDQISKLMAELPKQDQKLEAIAADMVKATQAKLDTFTKEQESEQRKVQKEWSEKWVDLVKVQTDLARDFVVLRGMEKNHWSETQKLVGTLKEEAGREKDRIQAEMASRFSEAGKNLARLEKDLQTQRELELIRKKMEDEVQSRLRLEADTLREKLSYREEKIRGMDQEVARLRKELLERLETVEQLQTDRTQLRTMVKSLEVRVKTLQDRPRIIQGVPNLVDGDSPLMIDPTREPRP